MKERPGSISKHEAASTHPDVETFRTIERLRTGDLHRVRFARFLERLAPLADLPSLPEDWGEIDAETAVDEGWAALIARLRSADPAELLAYVRERISWGMDQGRLDGVWTLAQSLKMQPELETVKRKWAEKIYAEYSTAGDIQDKRKILARFMARAGQDDIILGEERGKEMYNAYYIDQIRELYRFKSKVRSGEAFTSALEILRSSSIALRTLNPDLLTMVHADAVKRVNEVARNERGGGHDKTRRLVEEFLKLGLLDLDQDADLIEPLTRPGT